MKSHTVRFLVLAGLLAGAQAHAGQVSLSNEGFEADWIAPTTGGTDYQVTFYYAPTGPEVASTFNGGAGVAAGYSLISAYQRSRFGFLQVGNPSDPFGNSGSWISQSFNLTSAADVALSFAMALRPGYQAGQSVAVALDGQILTFFTATPGWSVKTLNLGVLASGTHTLGFAGMAAYNAYGDTTAYLDAVQLSAAPVPEPETWVMLLAGLGLMGWGAARKRA